MEKELVIKLNQNFEQAAFEREGVEFWLARDLQILLEYTEWRNFSQVIEKAKIACINSGQKLSDHFVDVNKMVTLARAKNIKKKRIIY
jgi:DNA-damage-inducible protein D